MEAARASIVAPEVSFRLDGPAVRKRRGVLLRGLLENAKDSPVSVTIFSSGNGMSGPFGFLVEPATSCATRKPFPPGPRPPMQVPPPPLIVEIPGRTAIRVDNDVALDEYDWIPGAPIVIEWTYQFWNEPRPRGTILVRS